MLHMCLMYQLNNLNNFPLLHTIHSYIRYILVDLDGNGYDGFVFMYDTGDNGGINGDVNSNATNKGGYAKSEVAFCR